LASLKKIIVNLGDVLRDSTWLHILPIEEATDTSVFGRGEAITDKRGGDRVEAGIVETIHAGIPTSSPGKNTSILQGLICS